MSQYFDKDFFKFSIGFAAIIVITLVLISATRIEASKSKKSSTQQSFTNNQ